MKKLLYILLIFGTLMGIYYAYFRIDIYLSVKQKSTDLLPQKKLHLILDLNGVLINTNSRAQRNLVGLRVILSYMLKDWYKLRINHPSYLLFNFIASLKPQDLNQIPAVDKNGVRLPQYMCDWLKGIITSSDLLEIVTKSIDESTLLDSEKNLLHAASRVIFDPETFIKTRTVEKNGLLFAKTCKEQGYQVYAITNWDPASFALLQQKFPEVFQLLDGIAVSGNAHLIKPDPAFYRYALKKFKLSADSCVFIDDIAANVEAARHVGMHGIVCPQKYFLWKHTPRYSAVLEELASLERYQES